MMYRVLTATTLALSLSTAYAQDEHDAPFARPAASRPATFEFNFTPARMPDGSRIAMLGVSYMLAVNDDWGVGLAGYGAARGSYGGLINWGVTVQRRWRLGSNTHLAAGFYAGAGGGRGGTGVSYGGGLMIRPELSLRTELDNGWYTGIGVAELRYPNGTLHGGAQFSTVLGRAVGFSAFAPGDSGSAGRSNARTGIGIDEVTVFGGAYDPSAGSRNLDGSPTGHKRIIGADLRQYIAEGSWWGLDAAAAGGGSAGYMDAVVKLGQDWGLGTPRLRLGGELGIGLGGGGHVDTGNGWLLRAGPTLRWIGPWGYSLHLDAGLLHAPSGAFSARYLRLGLSVPLDRAPNYLGSSEDERGTVQEQQVFASVQHLPNMRGSNGATLHADHLVIIMTHELAPGFYGVAQAGSAAWGQAGGYSVALLGLGVKTRPLLWGTRLGVELMAGAAGGGGVDVGRGPVGQAELIAQWNLSERLRLRAGLGRWQTLMGDRNGSGLAELSLGYAYGTLSR
ncbi:MAG: hypothetical protein JO006_14410 [Paucibacter sp.]|nr:hypothetical protein [Roseateles sp.]